MKKFLSIFVLATLLFTSCKKEETAESASTEETATDTTAVATSDSLTTAAQQAVPAGTDASSVMSGQPSVAGQTVSTSTAAPAAVAKGMNPAHGQPGHRCDISVGAPLNSPPGKKPGATTTTQSSTTVTPTMLNQNGPITPTTTTATPAASATPVVTAPGMNPPHGQEGHVCSVAVGAPLPKN